mmetsp:Transcript_9779/g.38073  ORF Transcript_9779/g.38073 Transcript_9779/m.38073 type:complete len:227 (+) Transcript_9779:22-702(+)
MHHTPSSLSRTVSLLASLRSRTCARTHTRATSSRPAASSSAHSAMYTSGSPLNLNSMRSPVASISMMHRPGFPLALGERGPPPPPADTLRVGLSTASWSVGVSVQTSSAHLLDEAPPSPPSDRDEPPGPPPAPCGEAPRAAEPEPSGLPPLPPPSVPIVGERRDWLPPWPPSPTRPSFVPPPPPPADDHVPFAGPPPPPPAPAITSPSCIELVTYVAPPPPPDTQL